MQPQPTELQSLDQWDDEVRARYDPNRKEEGFRNYGDSVQPVVREFYRLNHANQTRAFVEQKRGQWLGLDHAQRGHLGDDGSSSTRWWTTAIRIPT